MACFDTQTSPVIYAASLDRRALELEFERAEPRRDALPLASPQPIAEWPWLLQVATTFRTPTIWDRSNGAANPSRRSVYSRSAHARPLGECLRPFLQSVLAQYRTGYQKKNC